MSETLQQETLPALITDNEISIIQSIPEALRLNKDIADKATMAGEKLLQTIQANGMTDELDTKTNDVLVKMRTRVEEMYDRRTPATKLFDKMRGLFTEQEKRISAKESDSIATKLTSERNKYAAKKAEEQRVREAEIKRKQDIETAKINILAEAKLKIRSAFEQQVGKSKKMYLDLLDTMTLENYKTTQDIIEKMIPSYKYEYFIEISYDLAHPLLKWEELQIIRDDAKKGLYDEYKYIAENSLYEYKAWILQQLPGKVQYLNDLAKASADKKAEMEAAEIRRKQEEAERAEKERIQREADAAAKIEAEKQNSVADSMFNNVAEVLQNTGTGTAAKETYEIEVLSPAGWVLIFQKWFEKEGITKDNATIEKKSLGQMKAFCEKLFDKNGEKIESQFLSYSSTFKTRAKK